MCVCVWAGGGGGVYFCYFLEPAFGLVAKGNALYVGVGMNPDGESFMDIGIWKGRPPSFSQKNSLVF